MGHISSPLSLMPKTKQDLIASQIDLVSPLVQFQAAAQQQPQREPPQGQLQPGARPETRSAGAAPEEPGGSRGDDEEPEVGA